MISSRSSGRLPSLRFSTRVLITIALLSLWLFLVSYLLYTVLAPKNHYTGLLDETQVHTGEDLHNSLDIRLASKASYPSSKLGLVQDLGTSDGITTQIVSFAVKDDNLTEYALLAKPATPPPAGGYPTIILCHGYVNPNLYSTETGYQTDIQFYAKNGFAVIKPDFRGQGLSLGQGQATSAYYSMAYNTDLLSLISAAKDTSYINKSNINLWGHSMGAYIALRAAVISKDIKHTILLSGPVGSLNQLYLSYVPPSDENNPLALKTRQAVFSKYGTPGENSSFWRYASPTSFLSQSNTTFQIHAGGRDPVVPHSLSADLDADLNNLHRTHEYYLYPDGLHNLLAQRDQIWSRSLKLLRSST